jgi:threonine dehydrogenase-like Zn-dependent dehydrogenase
MKAIAVIPGVAKSAHLREVPMPSVGDVAYGKGVLVKVLRVGVDGTDKEIHAAEYGAAPDGLGFLVVGHESFGRVEAVGPNVMEFRPGDYVVATVRRPGSSIYDLIGRPDLTTDDEYYERGISRRHGYLAEYYVEEDKYLVRIPAGLKEVAVLLEPLTIVQKGVAQAFEIQRRLRVWSPKRAAVMGVGTIGLLAALTLRLRGFEVTAFARTPKPTLNAGLIEEIGAEYVSTKTTSVLSCAAAAGPFDLVLEATGNSVMMFESMQALAKNGVLVLASVTGGDRKLEIPADRINLEFVLGNKVMVGTVNAGWEHFESGIRDMAQAETQYPGWLSRLLTHPVPGLANYSRLYELLDGSNGVIKAYCQVAEE